MYTTKKLISLTLAAAMSLSLAACGGGGTSAGSTPPPSGSSTGSGAVQSVADYDIQPELDSSVDYTQGDSYSFIIATDGAEDRVDGLLVHYMADQLNAITGGRIQLQMYFNGSMGTDTELCESTQAGDVAFFLGSTAFNIKVQSPDDMQGQKIRVMENQLHISIWQALGANPTPMAFSEVYMALQQGTIDAQENPFEVIYANRLYEQQDYVILTNHLPASHNLLISQVVYNGLSDTDKELIMAVGRAAIQYSREQCDARLSERMDLVAQTGTEIVELPADVLEQLRDKCSGVYDEVRATYGDELVDMQISTAEKYA